MITKQQMREALTLIAGYTEQLHKANVTSSAVNQPGCRVKLSSWGLEMQGKNKKKQFGTVIDFRQWMHFKDDGIVTVKWDGISKPDSMHISQIEAVK
jgi:hypothetical protein